MRSVAIVTGPDTYLDHLGVLSAIMEMPLLITDPTTHEIAKTFYPQAHAILIDPIDLTLEFLADHYDVIFESGKFWAAEMAPILKLLGKEIRFVYCPHGNSDKGHSLKTHIGQDIALYYGDHMLDLLKRMGAFESIKTLIRTGNYRLPFYRKHRAFYDKLFDERVGRFMQNDKKILLYAPTWQDGENPSSFFSHCAQVIEELSDTFNVIVKLHPFLEEHHPAHTYRIISQYEKSNVLFLTQFPAIYALLAHTDIYLGDYSSIGYDFLAFDRPLYFLTPQEQTSFPLHRCGVRVQDHLKKVICETLNDNQQKLSAVRKEVYTYAFGAETKMKNLAFSEVFEKQNLSS